jgi:hypothetical protein
VLPNPKDPNEATQPEREVAVPFGPNPPETAILLLAAAEETGRDQSVVRASTGVFYVPADLAARAGVEVMKETGHGW